MVVIIVLVLKVLQMLPIGTSSPSIHAHNVITGVLACMSQPKLGALSYQGRLSMGTGDYIHKLMNKIIIMNRLASGNIKSPLERFPLGSVYRNGYWRDISPALDLHVSASSKKTQII